VSEPLVLLDRTAPIAWLTLNRPDRHNAMSRALIAELSDALDDLSSNSTIRVVVLTGAGATFCSGMDLKEASELSDRAEDESRAVDDTQSLAHLIDQVHRFPKPVIAALQGDALAGGAGLALACDFVIAAQEAKLGYPEVRRGLVAAIVLHDLVRQVGDRRARELLLSGSPISADVAERWGLINRVVPRTRVRDEALSLASSLLNSAPKAITSTKLLLDEATGRPIDLRGAAAVSAAIRVGAEASEGMRAFVEKRPAAWVTGQNDTASHQS
jgi:methylglutaconyl-CoA hydratase